MSIALPMRASIFPGVAPRRATAVVPVTIYGNNRRCRVCHRIRRVLDRAGIAYQYADLRLQPDIEQNLRAAAGPSLTTPVVYVDGDWLMDPTTRELEDTLKGHGLWCDPRRC